MADKKLISLVVLMIVLSLGHTIDHFVRGDIRLAAFACYQSSWQNMLFLALALFFYLRNKIGPLFWAVTAGFGVALGWLAHFSPFTDQTPQYIFRAYGNPAAGVLAVAWLVALMLALIVTATYAEYLWARELR